MTTGSAASLRIIKRIRLLVFAYMINVILLSLIMITSHASIAYRKQLPPQRTVGGNGRVRNESTLSKEASLPAYITHIAKNQQEGHQQDLNQLNT